MLNIQIIPERKNDRNNDKLLTLQPMAKNKFLLFITILACKATYFLTQVQKESGTALIVS